MSSKTLPHKFDRNSCIIYTGGRCKICGYEFNGQNSDVFSFHHVNPDDKKYEIGVKELNRRLATTVIKELNKCVLLCENCHRLVHDGKLKVTDNRFTKLLSALYCKHYYAKSITKIHYCTSL